MPEQFVVPQFIDAEDKIFGPITARQFIILMVVILLIGVMFKLLPFIWFLVTGIPFFAVGVIIAFAKINGQPFHYFLLNILQTHRKPRLRVWDKKLNDSEVLKYMKDIEAHVSNVFIRKEAPKTSHLKELTLVVNTGGVYKPEEN